MAEPETQLQRTAAWCKYRPFSACKYAKLKADWLCWLQRPYQQLHQRPQTLTLYVRTVTLSCLSCRLVEENPERALSWFAVGCYYLCTQQYDSARRYFGKATTIENSFAAAWIGFGNAFAFQDESDQV